MSNRIIEAGRLFWMPARQQNGTVGLGLSSGLRNQTATATATEDLALLGAITDLDASLVTLRDASESQLFSNADTLLKMIAGKRAQAENFKPYDPPLILREDNALLIDALSAGGETNGNLVFLAEPVTDPARRRIQIPQSAVPFSLVLAAGLAGDAGEEKTVTTNKSEYHMLIKGGGTDLSAVSVRIEDPQGRSWMSDPTPIWAVFGYANASAQVIRQTWPRFYYLPPGGRLRVEFRNPASGAESGGHIYFDAVRWKS